jgi:hypothetical protein
MLYAKSSRASEREVMKNRAKLLTEELTTVVR